MFVCVCVCVCVGRGGGALVPKKMALGNLVLPANSVKGSNYTLRHALVCSITSKSANIIFP